MSLISILIGESQYQPPPGIERSVRNFKIDPIFIKAEPKPAAKKKAPKPPKPKKKTSHDIKLENMVKIVAAIHAGSNTQMIIAKKTNLSHTTVCVLARQLEAEKRITVDHNSTPKKYYKYGRLPYQVSNKRFALTPSRQRILDSVNNGAYTQDLVAQYLGVCIGYPSRLLRELVDNKLIRCDAKKWPREYYPMKEQGK